MKLGSRNAHGGGEGGAGDLRALTAVAGLSVRGGALRAFRTGNGGGDGDGRRRR